MCPGILRLPEPRFLGRRGQKDFQSFLRTQVGDVRRDENVDKMVELCFSRRPIPGLDGAFWRFKGIDAAGDPLLAREIARRIKECDRTLGTIARVIIEELLRFIGEARACVKFPVDVRHTGELMNWFPSCKIVHITRDPRALAISKSNDPSGTARKVADHPRFSWAIKKAALFLVIREYRMNARVHTKFKRCPNYRLFRYEDLLAEPRKTLLELCDFIEAEFNEDMLEPQKGRHEHQPSSITGKQQKAFDAEAAVRWKKVISPVDNFIVMSLTRSSMKRLGYDPNRHAIFSTSRGGGHGPALVARPHSEAVNRSM